LVVQLKSFLLLSLDGTGAVAEDIGRQVRYHSFLICYISLNESLFDVHVYGLLLVIPEVVHLYISSKLNLSRSMDFHVTSS
jgi:predicted transcriptional regulator